MLKRPQCLPKRNATRHKAANAQLDRLFVAHTDRITLEPGDGRVKQWALLQELVVGWCAKQWDYVAHPWSTRTELQSCWRKRRRAQLPRERERAPVTTVRSVQEHQTASVDT